MGTREYELLQQMLKDAKRMHRKLESPRRGWQSPRLEHPLAQAEEMADRLVQWLDDMVFIAETELYNNGKRGPIPGRVRWHGE